MYLVVEYYEDMPIVKRQFLYRDKDKADKKALRMRNEYKHDLDYYENVDIEVLEIDVEDDKTFTQRDIEEMAEWEKELLGIEEEKFFKKPYTPEPDWPGGWMSIQ